MYAVIKLAGHQHKVEKDMVFLSELTGTEEGKEFTTDAVLLVGEGASVKVGKPFVAGAQVTLKVLANSKAPKIHGFTYRKRKGIQTTWGHRQNLQRLQVVSIKG